MPPSASAQGLGPPPDLTPLPLLILPFLSGTLIPSLPHGSEAEAMGNSVTCPGTQHLAQPGIELSFCLAFPMDACLGGSVVQGAVRARDQWQLGGQTGIPHFPPAGSWGAGDEGPLHMGTCPSGGLIRSSGSLSRCPVCRILWTKQGLGDSPPFPALVIHQPPFSWHQRAGGVRGGGPSCTALLSWEQGIPFPQLRSSGGWGAQLWWRYRFPECPAPQPIASQAEEIQKLPRCRCGRLRICESLGLLRAPF